VDKFWKKIIDVQMQFFFQVVVWLFGRDSYILFLGSYMAGEETGPQGIQLEEASRPSAFKLKEGRRVDAGMPRDLERAAEAGPLGELAKDEGTVANFTFYLNEIRSRGVSSEAELVARFAGDGVRESGGVYLLTNGAGGNYLLDSQGRYIRVPEEEFIGIADPEQQALLTELFTEVNIAGKERTEAEDAAKGLSYYAAKILDGGISSEAELVARFAGDGVRESGGVYLLTNGAGGNYLLDSQGRYIRIPEEEFIGIADPEQRALLLQLYSLTKDPETPDEVKTLVGSYVQSGDVQDLNRLKAILAERPDAISERVEAFVETFDTQKRRITLRQQFYTALFAEDSIDPARALLEGYEEKDIEDRLLVAELGGRALDLRRARVTRDFASILAAPDGDIDETLGVLEGLGRTPLGEDLTCAITLTEAAYRLELARNTEKVVDMKTADIDVDPVTVYDFIETLPKRPSVGELDYLQTVIDIKERARDYFTGEQKIRRLKIGSEIRREFPNAEVSEIFTRIDGLSDDTAEDIAFKAQVLGLYKNYIAVNRPGDFDQEFADQIFAKIQEGLQERFIRPELGTNREAAAYLASNYREVISPLVNSFRDDPRTKKEMNKLLKLRRTNGDNDPQTQEQIDGILDAIREGNQQAGEDEQQAQEQMGGRVLAALRERGVTPNFEDDPQTRRKMERLLGELQKTERTISSGGPIVAEAYKTGVIESVRASEKAKALNAAKKSDPDITALPEVVISEIDAKFSTFEEALLFSAKEIDPEVSTLDEAQLVLARRADSRINSLEELPLLTQRDRALSLLRLIKGGTVNPRAGYIQRLADLEQQRPLTDVEREYLRSVQFLSLFNPELVSVALADQGVTTEFLRHHFDKLAHKTIETLQDGMYIPALLDGTGPQGLTAIGEIVRNNPELAKQLLVIDSGEEPGGPFAIPRGPAWELNSANRRGGEGIIIPNTPGKDELKTVRAFGAPRYYPGERKEGEDVRQGSINSTVDYLPVPDNLSTKRYPTNEEEALILGLQAAMTIKKVAFNTELLSVEPNPNQTEKGNKIATVKITNIDGTERIVRIKTDAILDAAGLGEGGYGFEIEGSRAEQVLEQTEDTPGFPKISKTLEFFKELADRKEEKKSPGRTLVISGRGNSADTLIENIAGLFQGNNPLVRDITKIYVICEGDLSNRPRYASIRDVRERNGRGNLVEFINARVNDVDFATTQGDPDDRELVFYNADDEIIRDEEGNVIKGDSFVAATGFRPKLDKIYASYLDGKSFNDMGKDAPVQALTLPTNPDVAVADYLAADPSIVFLGTASKPRFTLEKFAQLPKDAREALLRNGAENAVAIGFRAPDTQAAINIWLNSREVDLEEQPEEPLSLIPLKGDVEPDTQVSFEGSVDRNNLAIADNVTYEELLLSPLLSYELENRVNFASDFSGEAQFELVYDDELNNFTVSFKEEENQNQLRISSEFLNIVKDIMSDEDFQRYSLSLLGKRRRNPKLSAFVSFQRGKVNAKNTFVQAA
jgi:hypothetical protein